VTAAAVAVVGIGSGMTGSVEAVCIGVIGLVLAGHIVKAVVGVAYFAADRAVAGAAVGFRFLGAVVPGSLGNGSLDQRWGLRK
jgi:hypothetical protein